MTVSKIGPEPNKELIEEIETLLWQAKSGELQGIAVATVNTGGEFVTLWNRGTTPILSLVGAAEMLRAEIVHDGMEWD